MEHVRLQFTSNRRCLSKDKRCALANVQLLHANHVTTEGEGQTGLVWAVAHGLLVLWLVARFSSEEATEEEPREILLPGCHSEKWCFLDLLQFLPLSRDERVCFMQTL